MNFKTFIAGAGLLTFSLASCIQDEALNQEAAIDGCTGSHIQQATINAENHTIQLYVSGGVNLQRVEIHFELPEGATVAPKTKSKGDEAPFYNFSEKQTREFEVVSEDQANTAVYQVSLWQTQLPTKYHFELLSSENPYHIFYEIQDGKRLEWASGNPGFKLTGQAGGENAALNYPTVQMKDGGFDGGKYVKLETRDTGLFGAMASKYIAAGNLFIGSFDVKSALSNPLTATQFGFPFFEEPVSLEGYYKFQRGAVYKENNKQVQGKQDECDIYGVLYEVDEKVNSLDGGNSLTSDHIVMMARFKADKGAQYEPAAEGKYLPEKKEWTKFKFPFVVLNGKTLDAEKLKKGGYKLAIVFSSSVDGAYFKGSIGSTLCVDEVTLTVK
ncbi:lipoprotein [gut metagenome]|uniref:Lipoprotein n=1 Tax=gut metagenome TaxID=749906 RepID=J9CXG8_9ZZZZ